MSKVILVANQVTSVPVEADCNYIGVDGGALYLMDHDIPMQYAIGDFDSISKESYERLKAMTKIMALPVRKNESDSEYAIRFALQHYDEVLITGVSGGRLDHFMAIYNLLAYSELEFTIFDEQNIIFKKQVGVHTLHNEKKYISLFALEPSIITISDVKYPLVKRTLLSSDIYTLSNEAIDKEAILNIEKGKLMVIFSDDR